MKTNRFLLAYLWDLSRGQRGRILLSCLIGILGTAFALGFVYTSKQLIDIATGARAGSLTVMAAATVGLLALQLLCGAADTWVAARMGVETANALRHRLFGRLLRSRWNALEQLHTGDVVNRVEQDTTAIVTLLTASLPTAVVTVVQLVAAFAFFYVLDPVLPWLVVGILPLFLLGARFYLRRMKRFTHDIRRSDSRIQAVIQETLQHRTVIKTLEQDEGRIRSLGTLQDALRSQVLSRTRFSLAARMAVSAAFAEAPDTYTSASVADYYGAAALTGDALMDAINSTSGFYLVCTTNPDGSANAGYFIYGCVKHEDKYYLKMGLAANQSKLNLETNGKGLAVYAAVPGDKPYATAGARMEFTVVTDAELLTALGVEAGGSSIMCEVTSVRPLG